ncbi:sensor histidine kinase [Kitasatospora sp. NPDC057692]|uniref:sensor histidine kinase n=1 Tax=Kitasatospora sp. NPDC057692 TaxID=3346215 RepID=UPI003683A1DC
MALILRRAFTVPGRRRRGPWRAFAEVAGGAVLVLVTQLILQGPGPSAEVRFLLAALALALLAVRRRRPVASLLCVSAVLGLLPAAGLPAAMTAYTTARRLTASRRRGAVLLAAAAVTTLSCGLSAPVTGLGGHSFGFATGAVLATTVLVVPGLLGIARGQEDRLLGALRERAATAEAARRIADSEARLHERSRIAAEMHDLIGHRLSLISLHTGGLEMALQKESPELRDEAALVRRTVGDAMRELREVLDVLGPLDRDTGTGALTGATGTRPDVEALVTESRSCGIPVDLRWEGPDLDERPAQVRRAVHRVVRESLTNVHRYAAGARVAVAVTHTADGVEVLVRNGPAPVLPRAADGAGSGRGHAGLRERVALLGGVLEAGPTPVGGFAVTARIPARPDPEAYPVAVELPPGGTPSGPSAADATAERPPTGLRRRFVGTLGAFLGLLGVGVMMMGSLVLVGQAFPDPEPRSQEPPRIGMPRALVEQAVYGDSAPARAAATGREPARPEAVTDCLYSTLPFEGPAADGERDPDRLGITRYCFRGDTLAAIDRFTVPLVSRTPPWESP